jgi:proline iminopeptidase
LLVAWLIAAPLLTTGQSLKSFYNGSVQLFYEEKGSGPALYILSGGPGEPPDDPYRQIMDSLQSYYTCVLLHQRGAGRSRGLPINEKTITLQNYTEDLEQLRKVRGDRKIALLGISWGGMLAMNYAAHYGRYVDHLLLIASGPPSYRVWNVLYENQFSRRSRAELDSMAMWQQIFAHKTERELDSLKRHDPNCAEVLAYRAFIGFHVRAMYYDRSKISKEKLDRLFYDFNFQPIPIIDREVPETRWDITDQLRKLSTPALIVYGRQDDQGESTFYLQKESLRNSEVHVIERCGHEIVDEQPVEFFRILLDYVRRQRKMR